MRARRRAVARAVCVLVVWVLVASLGCRGREEAATPGEATPGEATPQVPPPPSAEEEVEDGVDLQLYFPGEGERLYAETHRLPRRERPTEQAGAIVEALVAGPRSEGLVPPLPQGVSLGAVYQLEVGELIVDLISAEGPPSSSGSSREMLAAYSLVNSVVLNVEGVDRVVILWNDRQQPTFGGHLDTTRALAANPDLVARP